MSTNAPSTGGRPPRIQLNTRARRKSHPDSPPSTPPSPATQATFFKLKNTHKAFTDHAGNTGLSIYAGSVRGDQTPLLPSWSYQVYVTSGLTCGPSSSSTQEGPAVSSEALDFCTTFYADPFLAHFQHNEVRWIRFDFLFLPSAAPTACMRHYRTEKAHRSGTELALVPTYGVEGRRAWGNPRNAFVLVDRADFKREGVLWFEFDADEEGDKGPEEFVSENWDRVREGERYRVAMYQRGFAGWIGEHMGDLWEQSRVREEWEAEYQIARKLMEA